MRHTSASDWFITALFTRMTNAHDDHECARCGASGHDSAPGTGSICYLARFPPHRWPSRLLALRIRRLKLDRGFTAAADRLRGPIEYLPDEAHRLRRLGPIEHLQERDRGDEDGKRWINDARRDSEADAAVVS